MAMGYTTMSEHPFAKLLKCYVLNAIDELPPSNRSSMIMMEPLLRQTYGCDGSWDEIVAAQMEFPEDLPNQIRQLWEKNRGLAANAGQVLLPVAFAEMFLRHHFPYVFEGS
jgi:hypothetical protein